MQDSTQKFSGRRTLLGIVLGFAIGLLIESALVVMLRGPIIFFVISSFGLILILPMAGGIKIGILFVRKMVRRDFSWPAIVLLALILWPTAVALPFGVHILKLRHVAHNAVPTYPGAQLMETTVDLGDGENNDDHVRIRFVAEADISSIVSFYRSELVRRGWEEGPQHFIESKEDDTPYWFTHKSTFEIIHIKFGPPNELRNHTYEVIYGI